MPTNLRIFVEFTGHFLPILGDSGIYHVFPIPANCSTVNDVAYEIIKKYELQSLAPHGVQLKINNKYVLLARDNIKNSIREGDELHITPRIIQSNWNTDTNPNKLSSKKRKKPPNQNENENENDGEIIITPPPPKKQKISHINSINSDISAAISVISNSSSHSSASSSVTCYSSTDSEDNNNNHNHNHNHNKLDDIPEEDHQINNTNILHDINDINGINGMNDSSSSDADDESTDTSQDSIHNEHKINSKQENDEDEIMNTLNTLNTSNIMNAENTIDSDSSTDSNSSESGSSEDSEQDNQELENNDTNINRSISTLNDALKEIQHCKDNMNMNMNKGIKGKGYMRSIKVNDRIKIYIDNEWEYGTVKGIENNNMVELLMDNNNDDIISVFLDVMEWDFEPHNFAAPRVLKKINKMNGNINNNNNIDEDYNCNKIKRLIEECGNNRIDSKDLQCDVMIGYKTLDLVNWEPKHSKFKMGKVVGLENDMVIIEHNGNKQVVMRSNLVEIYEIKGNDYDPEENLNEKKLKQIKEKRKKRRQKQKENKAIGRSKSE